MKINFSAVAQASVPSSVVEVRRQSWDRPRTANEPPILTRCLAGFPGIGLPSPFFLFISRSIISRYGINAALRHCRILIVYLRSSSPLSSEDIPSVVSMLATWYKNSQAGSFPSFRLSLAVSTRSFANYDCISPLKCRRSKSKPTPRRRVSRHVVLFLLASFFSTRSRVCTSSSPFFGFASFTSALRVMKHCLTAE